ncbi:MAG: hypothetical protein JWO51_128 [Rhodospirillales bacterium]|nr:hypothetical protein [Rhodospirillales bacterium]
MRKILLGTALALCLSACATGSGSVVTTANVETACGWVQTADIVFKAVAPLSGGKITQAMIDDEMKADQAATVICTPPYPTDAPTALAKLLKIVAQIQTATPAQ